MKRILFIVSTLKRSGPTNQLFNIISNLDRSAFEPILITLSPDPEDSKWQDYKKLNFEMHSLNLSRIKGLFLAKSRLNTWVKNINPDLIHTQGARADVLSAKLSVSIPRVCTVRNFPQLDYEMTYGLFLGKYLTLSQVSAFKNIDLCCCVSSAVSQNLKNLFDIINTQVVYNGVDNSFYQPISKNIKENLRKKLGIPKNAIVWISSIGKDKRKNSLYIIEEFLSFLDENSNHYLVFIGDGELRDKCEILSSNCKQVLYFGRTNDVKSFLQASDYFVSASMAEGFPNAVLESMACGLPCVLSDIPPHEELHNMAQGGIHLFSLKPGSLGKVLQNKKESTDYSSESAAVSGLVSQRLSFTSMSQNYQNIYKKLLG